MTVEEAAQAVLDNYDEAWDYSSKWWEMSEEERRAVSPVESFRQRLEDLREALAKEGS